jgi:hypothetical protein
MWTVGSDMSMNTHITQLVSSSFGVLRQIRGIRRSLPRSALAMLVCSFVLSKINYCNVALAGLPRHDLERLQSVVNAAARLTDGARKYDHIMPLLRDLHWLRVPDRDVNETSEGETETRPETSSSETETRPRH